MGENHEDLTDNADLEVEASVDESAAGTEPDNQTPPKADVGRQLEDLRAKADEHWEQAVRAQAELENIKKRTARDIENAHKYGLDRIMAELLPVKDSMEMGLSAASEEGAQIDAVREGLELTLKMLTAALEKFGLAEVDPQGDRFDPDRHQAISMREAEGAESNSVLAVIQKGYTLNDRLVRPAMVIVAK